MSVHRKRVELDGRRAWLPQQSPSDHTAVRCRVATSIHAMEEHPQRRHEYDVVRVILGRFITAAAEGFVLTQRTKQASIGTL